jgi:hypothetical protein
MSMKESSSKLAVKNHQEHLWRKNLGKKKTQLNSCSSHESQLIRKRERKGKNKNKWEG